MSDSLTVRDTEQKLAFKEPRTSSRQKKPPTTKNDDFFMVKDNKRTGINSISIFHQNICGLRKKSIISQDTKTSFSVFHQNIRGLLNKSEELISFLSADFPQVLCLTEHHLKYFEIDFICMDQYKLGAKFCRESYKSGGVSIFVCDTLQCTNINLDEFCKEQDIKACAVKINVLSLTIFIICIYRSPTGNFLHTLDSILNFLHNNTIEIIICGDYNIVGYCRLLDE
jgi:hypothetical protein